MNAVIRIFQRIVLASFIVAVPNAMAQQTSEVDVIYPELTANQQTLTLTGTVEAKQNAQLASLQSGVVAELLVEEGDQVTAGQELMILDVKLAQLNLSQIKAEVIAAEASSQEATRLYREIITLSKKQLVAETLMAERKSNDAIAFAELARAKARLEQQQEIVARHTLRAPFAGVIGQRFIDIGEWVTTQTPVFTLVQQQDVRLRLAIPQQYYSSLQGQAEVKVVVSPDFAQGASFTTKLNRLVAVANGSSRTFSGLVTLPQDSSMIAGMSARAELFLPDTEQHIVWLPKAAIKQHPDGGYSIFTVENNKAKRLLVNIVERKPLQVAVTGAPENKPIVVSGVELLTAGTQLKSTVVKGSSK